MNQPPVLEVAFAVGVALTGRVAVAGAQEPFPGLDGYVRKAMVDLFEIGSATKPFTATLVAMLVSDGRMAATSRSRATFPIFGWLRRQDAGGRGRGGR